MLFQKHLNFNFYRYISFLLITSLFYAVVFLVQIYFNLFYQVSWLIFIFTTLVILINSRNGLLVFVFFAILSDTHYLYEFEFFNSIYTVKWLGINLIDWLLLGLVLKNSIEILISARHKFYTLWWDKAFIIIGMLVIIASIYGLVFEPKLNNWFVDIKLFVYLIIPYFLIRFWLSHQKDVFKLFKYIVLTLFAKLLVYTGFYFFKFGEVGPGFIKVTLTSDSIVYCLLILLCMSVLFMQVEKKIKLTFTVLAFMAVFSIIFSFGREIWVWSGLSFIIFFFLLSKKHKYKFVKYTAVGISFALIAAFFYYPSLFKYMKYNIQTFSLKTESVKGESSGAVRVIEWINVVNQLSDNYAILQGMGMGATWTDKYFPLPKKRDPFSFPTDENEHVFTHMATSRFLLKMGLIGSGIFWIAIFYSWLRSVKFAFKIQNMDRYFLLALLIGSITVIAKFDLVRMTLIGGFILGLIANFIMVVKQADPETEKMQL